MCSHSTSRSFPIPPTWVFPIWLPALTTLRLTTKDRDCRRARYISSGTPPGLVSSLEQNPNAPRKRPLAFTSHFFFKRFDIMFSASLRAMSSTSQMWLITGTSLNLLCRKCHFQYLWRSRQPGASSGLGLALTKRVLARGDRVIAAVRTPSKLSNVFSDDES